MKIKSQKGFTLIELLIVIAIIGILAAVLIPNLLSAQKKAKDKSIQSQISSLRAQALLFSDTGTYGLATSNATAAAACGTSTSALFANSTDSLYTLVTSIATLSGAANTACNTNATTTTAATAWAVAARGATTTEFFCADSTGVSRVYNASSSPAATVLTGASGTGAIVSGATACN